MSKKSIRFFNDREVRAVWDDDHNKWWFSATDIVRAINDEDDYKKCRNYWKYLKGKMAKDGVELVSVTNHFKFQAPDGKQRAADALDAACVQTLAKHYPNNRAHAFLECFTYSDTTIDGQSQKKAYTLFESGHQSSKSNISEHLTNIFADQELDKDAVVRKFRTTAADGKNYQVQYYNLDVIIALGYRVQSPVTVRFRRMGCGGDASAAVTRGQILS